MDQSQFSQFVKKKEYFNCAEFNNSPKSLLKLVRFIHNLEVNPESFQIAKDLIKFYRIPIMIAFEPFYQKIKDDYTANVDKYEAQIKQIASYVKAYLESYKLNELDFFYLLGTSKKKKSLQKSPQEIQFLEYIQGLGKDIAKLKSSSKDMNPQDLKLELDSILARGLNRKMNPLEINYQQYFKKQADLIYNANRHKIEQQLQTKDTEKKYLEPKPQIEKDQKKIQHLCCRQFFFDRQIIREPQNLVLEYKNYTFPFDQTRTLILKKTFCAFLNTNGGIIFLGIHQNVDSKMRKVIGMQLNQSQKQHLLKSIRMIAQSIQPDIITNKMYSVDFVPVKSQIVPNNYISGRFLAKIVIKYGIRDEIYSYRHDKRELFAFRTENEVIHRQGRQVLNAYRERLKNPLPIPVPLHPGPCQTPQKGREIYESGFKRKQYNQYEQYEAQKDKFPKISTFNNNFQNENHSKPKYKQRDSIDFILLCIKQKDLLGIMRQNNLINSLTIVPDAQSKALFLKITNRKDKDKLTSCLLIQQGKYQQMEVYEVQRGIKVAKQNQGMIFNILDEKKISPLYDKNLKCFKFKSTDEAVDLFLTLLDLKIQREFISI